MSSQCEFCQNVFKNNHGLLIHLKKCKTKLEKEKNKTDECIECSYCHRNFKTGFNLKRHLDKKKCTQFNLMSVEAEQETSRLKKAICEKDLIISDLQAKVEKLEAENDKLSHTLCFMIQNFSKQVTQG